MNRVVVKLGSLECTLVDQLEPGKQPTALCILCHGYGAPGTDLVSLAEGLYGLQPELTKGLRFLFPQGPIALDQWGMAGARAWWHLDQERMMQAQTTGEPMIKNDEYPEGLDQARRQLSGMLQEAQQQTGLPLSRVMLGGFSQGAMLATDLVLRLEEAVAGLCIMSGTLLCEKEWKKRAPQRAGLKVIQSHGKEDSLLAYAGAEALRDLLAQAGLEVTFAGFEGGHTIPLELLEVMAGSLKDWMGK